MLLRRLQRGESIAMPHSRPMPAVGGGCHELRVLDAGKAWRIMYCIRPDAIVILDVFAKTTAKTPQSVVNTCEKRLKAYRLVEKRR